MLPRLPAITKNRYEILFFYEDPSLLIDKKLNINLNNEPKNLNNEPKNLNNEPKKLNNKKILSNQEIEAIAIDVDFAKNIKKMRNKSNSQKNAVTVKNIGDINKKNNINYLNNYNIYSRLACLKFYFHYRDEDSLMKRLSGKKEFDYKYEGKNSIFKRTLKYLHGSTLITKLLNRLISDNDINALNEQVNYIKNILNNDILKIKNLPEFKNLNNNKIENIVKDLKINIINNRKEKNKEYKNKSDEEITKIMLEKINKFGIINKDVVIQEIISSFSEKFVDLDDDEQKEIKNILRLEDKNILKTIINEKSKKKKYFENNIKNAFNRIHEINPNIKYCLVIDIKKSLPYKLNKVDKEYNIIQKGGHGLSFAKRLLLIMIPFYLLLALFIVYFPFATIGSWFLDKHNPYKLFPYFNAVFDILYNYVYEKDTPVKVIQRKKRKGIGK